HASIQERREPLGRFRLHQETRRNRSSFNLKREGRFFNQMNPQMGSQNNPQAIEARILTMRVLWLAMLTSIAVYFVFTLFTTRKESLQPNPTISLTLVCVAVLMVLVSFVIKSKLLSNAVNQQNTVMVQQEYIVTWAITEVAA